MTQSPSPIEPDSVFDGLRWSSILRGAVLDNVLTLFALFPIMLYVAGIEAFSEDEETANQAIDQAIVAPEFLLMSFFVGISITVYAAYWASRRAGVFHLRHGGWTAVVSALLATVILLVPGASAGPAPPLWHQGLGLALMVPAGVFGGWLALKFTDPTA
jgi:hypothetical protein